jgi:ribonuclease-3
VLSARRAAIVSTVGLARLAHRIDLGSVLFLGEGEGQRGGRRRPSLLASTFEALAGALYLDIGWEATRDWLVNLAGPEIAMDPTGVALKSPKSRLQEFTQRRTGSRPEYRVIDAIGPDHEKLFRVEVVVEGRLLGSGEGSSRRVAETAAAVDALDELRREAAALKRGGKRAAGLIADAAGAVPGPAVAETPASDDEASPAETPASPDQPSQWSR